MGKHQQAALDAQLEQGIGVEAGPGLAVALGQDLLADHRAPLVR
jgi:hypothetical protein